MLYFGSDVAEYTSPAYQQLGDGGVDFNFLQVDSSLVFTAPAGAVLKTLELGADTAVSQAGGTIDIGIYDITTDTDGASKVLSGTLNLRFDDVGYAFHVLSGLDFALTEDHIYAIGIGKPTVAVYVTANGDDPYLQGESSDPATTSLSSTWTTTNTARRNIPLRAGYEIESAGPNRGIHLKVVDAAFADSPDLTGVTAVVRAAINSDDVLYETASATITDGYLDIDSDLVGALGAGFHVALKKAGATTEDDKHGAGEGVVVDLLTEDVS